MNRLLLPILIVCLAGAFIAGCGQPATAAPSPPSPTPTLDASQSSGCKVCDTQHHRIIETITAGSQHH
jgi:uncharacterized lipoprotein YajG